jgi:ankyrin repeat protein
MFAAMGGSLECVRLLLAHKASLRDKDEEGATALDWARRRHAGAADLLGLLTH